MHRNLRKITAILLIFILAFSQATFASAQLPIKELPVKKDKPSVTSVLETESPEKEVRVIVELKGEAPIEKATKRGVLFKSLSDSEQKKLQQEVTSKQNKVKQEIKKKAIKPNYLQDFNTVVNGFSAEVKVKDIKKIEKIKDVEAVHLVNEYERPEVKPDMKYSKELVEAQKVWRDFENKGEGMVVGVIDSGIDPTHKDMVLSDEKTAKLTEDFVNKKIKEEGLPGKYYTPKVPYAYNYMDETHEVIEDHAEASMHGMHVSGTVGANGDEEDGGLKGVAPEVQILGLKVFGNDPLMQSTFGDVYVKAIDDSIKLGADVLNLSLGAPAGFVSEDSLEQQAVTNAVENGIVVSISAGNSALFADGYWYPTVSNPDYGVNGSPGVAYNSLQVASFENEFMEMDEVVYSIDGEETSTPFMSAGKTHPNDVSEKTFELVEAGLGHPEEFEGKDLNGKYALVQRGGLPFTEKALNAQAVGAAGVIIYNNEDGFINMATEDAIVIPQLFMLKNDGDKLAEALKNGKTATVTFTGKQIPTANPDAGLMSDFTSWGLAPNLDFKPEITAPGGMILSTLNDDKYGMMSGTSMAAPHIAGGSALVLERIVNEFKLDRADRVTRAKNIMMNTSKPVDLGEAPVSPRRQGAGLAQLHAALKTPVMVTESNTKEAKVALKEITSNQVTFELTAENFTDESVTYEVQGNAQTDAPVDAGDVELITAPNLMGGLDLTENNWATVTVNGEEKAEIEVPANGTATVEVTVDVSETDTALNSIFKNGYWLEGFVRFVDPSDVHPDLTVPYVGFKGDWNNPPIFDKPMWDETSFYGMTGVVTTTDEEGVFNILGIDPITGEFNEKHLAISPNGDGLNDDATLILSFLRNAKHVKYNVLDENMKVVRTIHTDDYVRKNYYDGGRGQMYNLSTSRLWDGKIDGKPAPEGKYYLQAQAVIDYEGKDWQTFELPVTVDVTAPELTVELDKSTNTLHVDAKDNEGGSGLWYWDVLVNGESVLDEPYMNGETEHVLTGVKDSDKVSVVAVDYARNSTEKEVHESHESEDKVRPEVFLLTPEPLDVMPTNDVLFKGYATDNSEIVKITIDDEEIDFTYNKDKDRYEFETTLHYEDGFYNAKVKAEDASGNTREIGRRIFVDATPADLEIVSVEKVESEEEVTETDEANEEVADVQAAETDAETTNEKETYRVTVKIKDNFDEIRLYVNESEVYKNELSDKYSEPTAFDETIELEVELFENEDNEFKVVDLGGHTTIKQVNPEELSDVEEIVVNSPVVNSITEGDETITGKYEGDLPEGAVAQVHIKLPNGDEVVEPVDEDGNFVHELKVDLKAGDKVNVWVTVTYHDNEYVGESVTKEVLAKEEPPAKEPEDPKEPVEPEDPKEPVDPKEPGKPGDPGKPGKPGPKPPKVETPKDPPHPGAKKPGDGKGKKGKGSDDEGAGVTPSKGDNNGGKKGSDTNKQSDQNAGSKLPSTATNMWLYILIGALSVAFGGAMMFFRRRLQS